MPVDISGGSNCSGWRTPWLRAWLRWIPRDALLLTIVHSAPSLPEIKREKFQKKRWSRLWKEQSMWRI